MAITINLGKIKPIDRGAWSATYNGGLGYGELDIVQLNGDTYQSKVASNTAEVTDATKWTCLAKVGDKAQHGYPAGETPKTLKEVDDSLVQLAGEVISNQFYGIEWDEAYTTSACTRIGNQLLHATLPVHKKMRRCLLNDAGVVNYYLSATDSTKREDGRDAVLDGTDGQVMVELPAHYRKFEIDGTKTRCLISEYPLSGYHFVPKAYRSAYQATVQRSNLKLSSVKNVTADFRGGNNTTTWDATYRSLLGVPASNLSLTDFRTYARNRGAAGQGGAGWNCDLYELQKTTFWLYAIEYANFNSQLPHNAALTVQGYRQGGLGDGVTTLTNAAWSAYNSYSPFIPCGYTNSLGNGSGIVPFAMPAEYGTALTVNVPSYRGLENPFGHLWHWTDGLRVRYTTAADGDLGELYVQLDPTKYNSEIMTDYTKRGLLPPSGGYIKSMITGEFGENMPAAVGGSTTTYFADYHYQPTRPPETELIRSVFFGGVADYGANSGLTFSFSDSPVSSAHATIGSRLCFLP